MPKYAEPKSSQELRDAIRHIIAKSGVSEAEASRRLGFTAPSQLNRRLNDGKPPFSREEIERFCQVFACNDEQRVELLRLRGDVVIVQPGHAPQVVPVDELQSALAGLIDQRLKAELGALPALIAEAVRGAVPWTTLRERAGQAPQISFEHAQVGDVSIGAVAGRDVITIGNLQIVLPPPPPPLDPVALLEAMPVADDAPVPPADPVALGAVPKRIELLPNEQFTGRDHELRTLARQLKAGRNMVVTTGMGGVGKTQLASEFAYRYGRYFAGGVFWIDCSVPERVPAEIAAGGGPGGLDLPGFTELPAEEQVRQVKKAWSEPIPRLLIFDNCEDEKLLRAHRPGPGGCRVLVTSRRQQWSPGQNLAPLDLDVLGRPFSIDLLQKLANPRRSDPIRSEQADAIAEELGDLPLALHLAGSYLALFDSTSPEAFLQEVRAKRLEQPALANADELYVPTLEAQQRASSLYAVLTIGLERLNPADAVGNLARALLARAACLEPPGVTFPRDLLSRTAPIASDNPEQLRRADQALNLLINLGFLDMEAGGRLRMHRLIVAAVQQAQLVAEPLASFAPAALGYCLDLIARADSKITSGQIVEGRAELDQDQALWSQFLDWSYDHEANELTSQGARATALLSNYWTLTGDKGKAETLARLQRAMKAARNANDRFAQANVLKAIGDVQQFRKETSGALSSYQQALALFREIGDRLGEANVLKAIGDVQQFRKETSGALSSYQQALALFREIGDRLGEANVLQAIGDVQQFRKETSGALSSYQQALALFREIGAKLGEANVLKAIGDVQQFRKETSGALSSYQQALALFREIGDRLGEANVLQAIGDVQQFRKETSGALSSYQQALALFREIGAKLGEANVLAALSRLMIDSDPAQSQSLLQQALAIREAINDAYDMGADLGNYGIALLQRGRNGEALPYLERARAIFAERGITELLPQMDALIAQARAGAGPAPDALADFPEPIRRAIAARDNTAFAAAMEALSEEERRAVIERLQQAGIIALAPQPYQPRPDIDQVIQAFLPILGDIALAMFGDETARQLAEAVLPRLEEGGWRLEQAARRIWAGERSSEALTAGIDPNSAALVRRTLRLVEEGPGMILAAGTLQIAHTRRQAEAAAAQALARGDAAQRAGLARQLDEAAGQAELLLGAPWQQLAARLRALAVQLREA